MQGSEYYIAPIYWLVIVGAWSVIAALLFGDLMRRTRQQRDPGRTLHYAARAGLSATIVVVFVLFVVLVLSVLLGKASVTLGLLLLLLAVAVILVARWVRTPHV